MTEPLDIPGLMPYPSVPLKYMPVDDTWTAEYARVWRSVMSGNHSAIDDCGLTGAKVLGVVLGGLECAAIPELAPTEAGFGRIVLQGFMRLVNEIASGAADEAARVALNKMESEDAE